MKVTFDNVGKRFIKEWIIKDLSYTFESKKAIAVTGANGSGKSTLLKLISGIVPITRGNIIYENADKAAIPVESVFRNISFCAPYQELIEEFTLSEIIRFHQAFRPLEGGHNVEELADLWQLSHALNKRIHFYSSGMKQRVRLGLAIYSKSELTLLDEPTSNLDEKGVEWYLDLIGKVINQRTLVVASNITREYTFCTERVELNIN
ncbi:MAG: ATP-binding cassette domain-containing protein [Cyclobacteriaceae bacterium]